MGHNDTHWFGSAIQAWQYVPLVPAMAGAGTRRCLRAGPLDNRHYRSVAAADRGYPALWRTIQNGPVRQAAIGRPRRLFRSPTRRGIGRKSVR